MILGANLQTLLSAARVGFIWLMLMVVVGLRAARALAHGVADGGVDGPERHNIKARRSLSLVGPADDPRRPALPGS
jgi:hypothetical protein